MTPRLSRTLICMPTYFVVNCKFWAIYFFQNICNSIWTQFCWKLFYNTARRNHSLTQYFPMFVFFCTKIRNSVGIVSSTEAMSLTSSSIYHTMPFLFSHNRNCNFHECVFMFQIIYHTTYSYFFPLKMEYSSQSFINSPTSSLVSSFFLFPFSAHCSWIDWLFWMDILEYKYPYYLY